MPANCDDCNGRYLYHLNPEDTDNNGTYEIHKLSCGFLSINSDLDCLETSDPLMARHIVSEYINKMDVDVRPSFCRGCSRKEEVLYC